MQYHPHIHFVVPGGAFSSSDHSWHSCPEAFYLPIWIMSAEDQIALLQADAKGRFAALGVRRSMEKELEC